MFEAIGVVLLSGRDGARLRASGDDRLGGVATLDPLQHVSGRPITRKP
ncbi:MAG TPA: hypothetical protein VKF40_19425 [Burkholderiales bacterium]|nr:hypothetical protein [Burkholderiales bacterium]